MKLAVTGTGPGLAPDERSTRLLLLAPILRRREPMARLNVCHGRRCRPRSAAAEVLAWGLYRPSASFMGPPPHPADRPRQCGLAAWICDLLAANIRPARRHAAHPRAIRGASNVRPTLVRRFAPRDGALLDAGPIRNCWAPRDAGGHNVPAHSARSVHCVAPATEPKSKARPQIAYLIAYLNDSRERCRTVLDEKPLQCIDFRYVAMVRFCLPSKSCGFDSRRPVQ
jgi:hypothetical protein